MLLQRLEHISCYRMLPVQELSLSALVQLVQPQRTELSQIEIEQGFNVYVRVRLMMLACF